MAGQGVAGGQGGAETVLGAREVWQVAWGEVLFRVHGY